MLCSGVNRRSTMNDTMAESTKIGCLATMKFTKKLKGLKQKKVIPQTPRGGRWKDVKIPEGKMLTPQNSVEENKENASSTGMTCRTASRLNGLGVRGQIKVSLQVENGLLTVHVVEGKQLKFKSGSSRNSYVQVSIMPEDDSMMRYTTRIQYNTASPRYDETFRHTLCGGDERKRVFIAVWSECGIHSQLVGCMSFGVKHLLYKWKSVAGWFYLLSEELGTKKHLKMFSSRQALHDTTNAKTSSLSANNSMTLLVTPNPAQHGYGFSVSGSSPSEVSHVIPGSAAYVAGLKPGDVILKIDTQNVAKSNGASINKIIQEANETLVMEVKRSGCDSAPESLPRPQSRSRLVPCSSISTLNSWATFDDNNNQEDIYALKGKRSGSRSSLNSVHSSKSKASSHHSHQSSSRSKDGSLKRMASQGSLKSTKRLEPISEENSPSPWQPTCQQNLSNDSDFTYHWKQSRKSCDGESDHGLQYLEKDCWDIVAQLDKAAIPKKTNVSMVPNASLSTNANDDSELPYDVTGTTFRDDTYAQWDNFQVSAVTGASPGGTTFFSCTTETQHMVSVDSGYSIALENTQVTQHSTIFADPILSDIAEQLLTCEDEFARKMHFGTERFSRPLRHCIISPAEQKVLFQNVEKLVAISEFHVKKLNELKYEAGSGVSAAYIPQLALTCDAYTIYCKGLARSLSLLEDFSENKEFLRFVQEPEVPEEELNITEFLEKPLLHLEELVYLLNQLVSEMSEQDLDYANMRHVLSALKGCYTNLQAEFTLLQDDGDSEEEYRDEEEEDLTGLDVSEADSIFQSQLVSASTTGVSSAQSSTMFSIDAELAALQNKLFFPSDVQPFQIVGPNRHVIYQSDLLFVHAWKWYKLNVTLLSDQLLLTKEESPDKLVAIMPPVFLKDICSWDFDGFHPSEFVLMLDNEESILRNDDSTVEPRLQSMVFRALETEQKSTWRHLLEQRVKSCRAQREYCL